MFFSLALTLRCNRPTDETFFYLHARALCVAPYSNFSSLHRVKGTRRATSYTLYMRPTSYYYSSTCFSCLGRCVTRSEIRRMGFSLSRGLLHPGLPVPASRRAHRDSGGGKWVCGVDHVAKQDKCVIYSFGMLCFSFFFFCLLHRIAAALRFLPQYTVVHMLMLSWMCDRHQRRVVVRTRLVAARSRL